jgi:hypothetical protein
MFIFMATGGAPSWGLAKHGGTFSNAPGAFGLKQPF